MALFQAELSFYICDGPKVTAGHFLQHLDNTASLQMVVMQEAAGLPLTFTTQGVFMI